MKNLTLLAVFMISALLSFSFTEKDPAPSVAKSLVFPVAGKKAKIGSFWGAVRDGGKRSHQGIDIFAKKGTPVVAICDGIISSRTTTPRGGKILWLRSGDHAWSVYYAHLDQQLVREGQFVKKGQVIGTVGKTGNAKTTPPHLHFGIYKRNGAVNPLPYVKNSPKISVAKKKTAATAKAAKSRSKKAGVYTASLKQKSKVKRS